MSELQIALIIIATVPFVVWRMISTERSHKIKKTGSTMIVVAMFGFAKIFEPSRVDVEEARQKSARKRQGENGDGLKK